MTASARGREVRVERDQHRLDRLADLGLGFGRGRDARLVQADGGTHRVGRKKEGGRLTTELYLISRS